MSTSVKERLDLRSLLKPKQAVEAHVESTPAPAPTECKAVTKLSDRPRIFLPDQKPEWAMMPHEHNATIAKTANYRCPQCGGDFEEYRQNPRDLPYAVECGCVVERDTGEYNIEERNGNLVRVPILEKCTAVALRRYSFPGELVPLNARRFEPMVIYQSLTDPSKFSFPGRNNEPTDAGYKRIEIDNIHSANYWTRTIAKSEESKMGDHRAMHQYYWNARRKAMRENVDARIRHSPIMQAWARLVRARSDRKSALRYGRPLNSNFHIQLMEYNQSNMQDFCDASTGWKSTRAR